MACSDLACPGSPAGAGVGRGTNWPHRRLAMSATFRLISWTPYKKRYDLVMAGLVVGYLAAFVLVGRLTWRGKHAISDEILVLRALGTCAFLMLNVALCI